MSIATGRRVPFGCDGRRWKRDVAPGDVDLSFTGSELPCDPDEVGLSRLPEEPHLRSSSRTPVDVVATREQIAPATRVDDNPRVERRMTARRDDHAIVDTRSMGEPDVPHHRPQRLGVSTGRRKRISVAVRIHRGEGKSSEPERRRLIASIVRWRNHALADRQRRTIAVPGFAATGGIETADEFTALDVVASGIRPGLVACPTPAAARRRRRIVVPDQCGTTETDRRAQLHRKSCRKVLRRHVALDGSEQQLLHPPATVADQQAPVESGRGRGVDDAR